MTVMKRATLIIAVLAVALVQFAERYSSAQIGPIGSSQPPSSSARVDPLIANHFSLRGGQQPIPVVITYKSMPAASDLTRLQLAGITKGIRFRELPMVIAPMNATQLAAVRTQANVKSIWANPDDGRSRCATCQHSESRPADIR
jgi:hypothetical protein